MSARHHSRALGDERGLTLVELLVTMSLAVLILGGILALTGVVMRDTVRAADRVEANQLARPVLQRLIDELHSTCLGPDVSPVLAGSTGSSLTFLHTTGSLAAPTPDRRVVTLTGNTLSDSVYASTGGTAPNWTFAASPTTRQLLTTVSAASIGSPPVTVPLFRYYASENGVLSETPLPTPLSQTNADRTVAVTVAFAVSPRSVSSSDSNAAVSVSDQAYLRFSPFSEDVAEVNVPCT